MVIYWICTALLVSIICYFLQELLWTMMFKKSKTRLPLPPGPKPLPILGNLHQIGKNPHQDLFHLSQKHGPIMYIQLGFVPAVVVSSPVAAEKFLKTHDLNFASRPYHEGSWHVAHGQRNLTFAKYGSYWRNMRKLCTLELLSNQRINQFRSMRREEIGLLIESFKRGSNSSLVGVDFSGMVASTSANMSCLMIFGKKYLDGEFDDRGFKDVIQELLHIAAIPNLGDFFPFMGRLDLQGLTRRFKIIGKVFDEFLEKVIDEHLQSNNERKQSRDLVDTMIEIYESGEAEFEFDRRHIKSVLLDLLIASMDTSATTVEWIFTELLRHPKVMKKLQKEIEDKVGRTNRTVEESDLEGGTGTGASSLEYLDMVIKETFRLHPVAPLLLPHESIEDCTIDGFHFPKGSRILINTTAIGRDPKVWNDPEMFFPERFSGENKDVDIRGRDFRLIPFGSGRRSCPGLQLGLTVVRLMVANLVHCFDWELPNGMRPEDLDTDEVFGLVTGRANHLMVVPKYRFA